MKPTTLQDYKRRLLAVLEFIVAHLDEPLPIDTLARLASLSPCHFHRVFTGMIGETVQGLVRRLRLERAAGELHNRSATILDIALDAGYESHEAFSRAFGRAFATTPSAFRRDRSASPQLPARSGIHFQADRTLQRFRVAARRSSTMKTTIKTLPSLRVACVRHTGPYHDCGAAWDRLGAIAGAAGDFGPGTQLLGISYDDPENVAPEALRYDAAFTVDDDFEPHDGLEIRIVAGGDYAVLTHEGPYPGLRRAYRQLMGEWLPRSGRELADTPCFETYLNDPDTTAPAELLTDIHAPLRSLHL